VELDGHVASYASWTQDSQKVPITVPVNCGSPAARGFSPRAPELVISFHRAPRSTRRCA